MGINRNNYEIFFIDFYDDQLTTAQKLELELFLESNPDLKAEFEDFENVTILETAAEYEPKLDLKKPEITVIDKITEENYEELFIAWYENDLDTSQKASVVKFLEENPHLDKEFQLQGSLIIPAEHIIYENKEQLKKKAFIGYYWTAAAAAILIFLAIGFFLIQNQPLQSVHRTGIAHMQKVTTSNTINIEPSKQLALGKGLSAERIVVLPAPYIIKNTDISLLATVSLQNMSLQQQIPVHLIEPELNYEVFLLASVDQPKQKGLLAQFFKRNVEEFTGELGIDNSANVQPEKKKEPGFVKFLDGSLAVFNTLTGSETELVKNYDKKCNLKNYSLEIQNLVVNRKLPSSKSSN